MWGSVCLAPSLEAGSPSSGGLQALMRTWWADGIKQEWMSERDSITRQQDERGKRPHSCPRTSHHIPAPKGYCICNIATPAARPTTCKSMHGHSDLLLMHHSTPWGDFPRHLTMQNAFTQALAPWWNSLDFCSMSCSPCPRSPSLQENSFSCEPFFFKLEWWNTDRILCGWILHSCRTSSPRSASGTCCTQVCCNHGYMYQEEVQCFGANSILLSSNLSFAFLIFRAWWIIELVRLWLSAKC